jgi:hypothetical protein
VSALVAAFPAQLVAIVNYLSRRRVDASTPSADEPEDELSWEPLN